jgi:transposase
MKKKNKSPHPTWALKHRLPGTELRNINNRYYLYEVSSKYDKVLKRAKKITGKLLGRITQDEGFMQSDKDILRNKSNNLIIPTSISVREYGLSTFIQQYLVDIVEKLKEYFPSYWEEIILITYSRFGYKSCIKNMSLFSNKSFLQEEYGISISEKKISLLLRQLGRDRERITEYMKSFIGSNNHVLVDMTNIFSSSRQISLVKTGYNSDLLFDSQFNLLYVYSLELNSPVFYRLYSGNIKDVKGFKMILEESGLNDSIIICNKGFYSENNILHLDENKLRYIIPLRRNNKLIDYRLVEAGKIKKDNCYFKHENRYIWYYTYPIKGKQIHIYQDDTLKQFEETDYLNRIETYPEEYTLDNYHIRKGRFGTISMITNMIDVTSEDIYTTYKSRINIELMFDGMKNVLDNDKTYMQNEEALQGWMFINHIALQWYYKMYVLLKESKEIKKHSINDLVIHLKEIRKVKINNNWVLEPIVSATEKFILKLGLHIT